MWQCLVCHHLCLNFWVVSAENQPTENIITTRCQSTEEDQALGPGKQGEPISFRTETSQQPISTLQKGSRVGAQGRWAEGKSNSKTQSTRIRQVQDQARKWPYRWADGQVWRESSTPQMLTCAHGRREGGSLSHGWRSHVMLSRAAEVNKYPTRRWLRKDFWVTWQPSWWPSAWLAPVRWCLFHCMSKTGGRSALDVV